MQNKTITLVAAVALIIGALLTQRWLIRKRVKFNRYGISRGKHSIGFHFGKNSAYAFPNSGQRTLSKRLIRVR